MGEVYLGIDPAIGREVAIKTILPAATGGEEAQQRFEREARAAGVLNHPNLVTIYEFGQDQGVLFIAMEYVKGHDLEDLLREQSLSRSESLEILAQICDGLAYAHHAGIVHRDIKPSNVRVIRDGRRLHAKVMDFGVAKVSNSDMTATGMVMGTVSYMAPEYIRTGKPDPRSDLFAVGVMLYECLSGRKPFAGDTTPTILYKIVNEPPEPIEPERLQGLSPATQSVLERALSKEPAERYQTAEELARALRAAKDPTWQGQAEEGTKLLTAGTPMPPATGMEATQRVAAVPPPPPLPSIPPPPPVPTAAALPSAPPPPTRRSKVPLLLAAGLGALVVLGGGGYLAFRFLRPGSPAVDEAAQGLVESPAGTALAEPLPAEASRAAASAPPSLQTPDHEGSDAAASAGDDPEPQPVQERRPPEPRTIDQPERYQPENLEKLEVHERTNLGMVSLSEAIRLADKDPDRAVYGFRQALKADPGNANARAWLGTVLLDQGRYMEAQREIREARRQGQLDAMMRNPRFRAAFQKARLNNKLAAED